LKERAVRMVFEVRAETGQKGGAVQRVAGQLGIG
jgi:transposase-like protein